MSMFDVLANVGVGIACLLASYIAFTLGRTITRFIRTGSMFHYFNEDDRVWVRVTDRTEWRKGYITEPCDPGHREYMVRIEGGRSQHTDPDPLAGKVFRVKAKNVRPYR